MSDIIAIILSFAALAASVYGYYRSRYWAKRSDAAAKEANLAYYRAHDSAMEAEENANRAEAAKNPAPEREPGGVSTQPTTIDAYQEASNELHYTRRNP